MTLRTETEKFYQEIVNTAIDYIHHNIDQEINLSHLADVCHCSKYHFHRIFKAYTGETVGGYIIRARMEHAARLLQNHSLTVEEIAYMVGYNVPSSFTKAFKQAYSVSPSEYKTKNNIYININSKTNMIEQKQTEAIDICYEIKELPQCYLAYVRTTGHYSEIDYKRIIPKLYRTILLRFVKPLRPDPASIYINDPFCAEKDDLITDIALLVTKEFKPKGEVGCRMFEGGRYVSAIYTGPYNKLNFAYDNVYKYLAANNLIIRNTFPMEFYMNDPKKVSPGKLKTEILIPIE